MAGGLTIAVESAGHADMSTLLEGALACSAGLYPPESCHGPGLAAYERPEVTLRVARADGVALGCGAWQLQDDRSAEVKSMYVLPDARGRGIGRKIPAAIEDALRGRATTLQLETGIQQDAALRLYESAGFRRRGPFGSYPDDPLSVFMEKPL